MALKGNLSTGKQKYPGTAQLQESAGGQRRAEHGPDKGQAFLLTQTTPCTASLNSVQTFLLRRELHPSPQEGGKKEEATLKLYFGTW